MNFIETIGNVCYIAPNIYISYTNRSDGAIKLFDHGRHIDCTSLSEIRKKYNLNQQIISYEELNMNLGTLDPKLITYGNSNNHRENIYPKLLNNYIFIKNSTIDFIFIDMMSRKITDIYDDCDVVINNIKYKITETDLKEISHHKYKLPTYSTANNCPNLLISKFPHKLVYVFNSSGGVSTINGTYSNKYNACTIIIDFEQNKEYNIAGSLFDRNIKKYKYLPISDSKLKKSHVFDFETNKIYEFDGIIDNVNFIPIDDSLVINLNTKTLIIWDEKMKTGLW